MTGFGPPSPSDDPSDRPTRMANYGELGSQPTGLAEARDYSADRPELQLDGAPTPWYRKRTLLALWALMVAILIALIVYGIVELSRGGGGGPTTTTPSTTPTRSSTTKPSPTTSTAPPSSTPATTPEESPSSPPQGPAPGNNSPAPAAPPTHHHHWPHIPPTISLPHTVITLPRGW
ncbi:MAG: hypothetical protein JO259_11525 [Mycobacterium sp.]|nr:hypothetical protein [Mycobacterium sp.]